jgi:glycosyltransferase involved in cell wall biosynthesis
MRILSITAGAASMYCGSCLRDNAMATELIRRGHEVTLVPLYTPTITDEPNVSQPRVLFGGVNIYLQQRFGLFRHLPRVFDRWLDSPALIRRLSDRQVSVDPRVLGDMTISMLEGPRGILRKEFEKLLAWVADGPTPDVVNLPNSMLIALAKPIADALKRPVCCTLQGEELFLQTLVEPYRSRALAMIRHLVPDVARFIAVSDYCASFMSGFLEISPDRISVVPLGVKLAPAAIPSAARDQRKNALGVGPQRAVVNDAPHARRMAAAAAPLSRASSSGSTFRVGYLARVAPEKGLQLLADAYVRLRARTADIPMSLEAAGYLAPGDQPYLARVQDTLSRAGLAGEFTYHGAVDLAAKQALLDRIDVLSAPAVYDEPKGLPLLEAMAHGVPVVQPRRGAFIEVVERTGGGLLVAPDSPDALAEGLECLARDAGRRRDLGRRAYEGVLAHYTVEQSAERLLGVYADVIAHSRSTCDVAQVAPSLPKGAS